MELTSRQKNTIIITIICTLLIVGAIVIGWYQTRKQSDLQTLSHVGSLRSSLALIYSSTSHYPIAKTPILIPNRDISISGYYGPAFLYQTDATGQEYRIQGTLLVSHRGLGLTKGVICILKQEITNGSCIIQ